VKRRPAPSALIRAPTVLPPARSAHVSVPPSVHCSPAIAGKLSTKRSDNAKSNGWRAGA
jgi:hypothetical protein